MIDPMMAAAETSRRYEVVSDGMQVARLLARYVRNVLGRNYLAPRADHVEPQVEAQRLTLGQFSQKQIKEAAQ